MKTSDIDRSKTARESIASDYFDTPMREELTERSDVDVLIGAYNTG